MIYLVILCWVNAELYVGVRDVRLAVVEAALPGQVLADGGEGAVAAKDEVGGCCDLFVFAKKETQHIFKQLNPLVASRRDKLEGGYAETRVCEAVSLCLWTRKAP